MFAHRMSPEAVLKGLDSADQPSELVRRAQSGDIRAFEQLYRDHAGKVYALCLRMAGNSQRAEELAQDSFVRAWEMLSSFRSESAFSSWLYRLTVNVVLVAFRGERRYEARVKTTEDLTDYDQPDHTVPRGEAMDLETAIAGLPDQARMIFVLHDVEGYKHDEIAEQMGIAAGTSKAQLHRARRLLREVLAQ